MDESSAFLLQTNFLGNFQEHPMDLLLTLTFIQNQENIGAPFSAMFKEMWNFLTVMEERQVKTAIISSVG
jgi:hypothetical protein